MLNITPENVGLKLCINHTRSAGVKLYVHRPNCSVFKSSFMHRATILWNSLPYSVCMHAILFTSNVSFNVTGRRMGLGRPWAIPILFSIIAYMYLLLICEWKINLSYYYY